MFASWETLPPPRASSSSTCTGSFRGPSSPPERSVTGRGRGETGGDLYGSAVRATLSSVQCLSWGNRSTILSVVATSYAWSPLFSCFCYGLSVKRLPRRPCPALVILYAYTHHQCMWYGLLRYQTVHYFLFLHLHNILLLYFEFFFR